MTKKISKVIVYYEDGTYEEVKASISDTQNKPSEKPANPSPVMPDLRPDYYKIRDWGAPTWVPHTGDPLQPPWVVTCQSGNVPLNYTVSSDTRDMASWSFTSTGNADNLNKYTITSTGNGNVDLSK